MAQPLSKKFHKLSCEENEALEDQGAAVIMDEADVEYFGGIPHGYRPIEPAEPVESQNVQWQRIEPFFEVQGCGQKEKSSANQVENNVGGFVYKITDIMRVRRFLILGTTGGTYYVKEKQLTIENAEHIVKMVKDGKGMDVLRELHEVNKSNRAPKMSPLIFCLAVVLRNTDDHRVQLRAYQLLPSICRIPTHLFEFVRHFEKVKVGSTSSGWGRAQRRHIASWYLKKSVSQLAMAVTKYQQREGWSHRDLLRLAHPRSKKRADIVLFSKCEETARNDPLMNGKYHNDIFMYCTQGLAKLLECNVDLTVDVPLPVVEPEVVNGTEKEPAKTEKDAPVNPCKAARKAAKEQEKQLLLTKRFGKKAPNHLNFLQAVEDLKTCKDEIAACDLIKRFGLVREHVPSSLLNSVLIWRTLMADMPMTAMIRNLGKMTAIKLIKESDNEESKAICPKLNNVEALKAARVHPLTILLALSVYRSGHGDKGKLKWKPNRSICDSLEAAFYTAFVNVQPTGKRFLLALDVSGSMMEELSGSSLSCREASMAMSLVTMRTEPLCEIVGFQDKLTVLPFDKNSTLKECVSFVDYLPFGSTDCAQPMLWAAQQQKHFDCFIVYTDIETCCGDVKPDEALRQYRRLSGIHDAKLIVVGMTASNFTIADPEDPNMMDIVGFDSSAPELIRNFVASGFEEPDPSNVVTDDKTGGGDITQENAWDEALTT